MLFYPCQQGKPLKAKEGKAIEKKKGIAAINQWQKEHTERVTLCLNHNTDADILEALEREPSKAGAFKRWARIGLQAEKAQE